MHIGLILTKTPAEEGFQTFIQFANLYQGKDKVTIYMIGNGVFCARKGHLNEDKILNLLENSLIYANLNDLNARGIKEDDLMDGIKIIQGYDGLVVDIMEKFDQILSF